MYIYNKIISELIDVLSMLDSNHHKQLLQQNGTAKGRLLVVAALLACRPKGLFGWNALKFNSHHINVPSNVWSTKCRLIACMSTQIRSNLRDESIKPN
jgi:hypothetical protein